MSSDSDGRKKSSSPDGVSKAQPGSVSASAIPSSGTSGKSSRKDKSAEPATPAIAVVETEETLTPRASSKSKSEKSSSSNVSKTSKSTTDDKGKVSSKKLLKEELAAAQAEVARLKKENVELREQLETLQGVISVQAEQRAMTKKQRGRQKQKQQQQADKQGENRASDDSEDEEEFGDDQETEMFDKAASSDDTQVKRKLQEHKRTRSNDNGTMGAPSGVQALVDAALPPKQRRTPSATRDSATNPLSQSLPGGRADESDTASASSSTSSTATSAATSTSKPRPTRPTRPTNNGTPPRKAKFATATNLSRTFISQEDEKELVGGGSGNDAARGRIMNNFALVSGEATPNSLKIGVLGTPDPNAKPSSQSPNDHPHIFDENTVLDILCGLGITSSRQFDDSSDGSVLIPKDFSYSYQFKVRRMQDQLLKFKDFAPKVFHQIRKVFNVTESELLFSFRYDNLDAFKGAGKSGAFFIFTRDKRFILKTATKEERDFLWELLPYYLLYIRKNPNTMLPRFYGVYSMKHEGIGGVVRFVVMNNWFATHHELKEKYDLKGSTVGRTVGSEPEKVKSGSILKDLDIKRKIYLPDDLYQPFLDQLKRDAEFLSQHNVMDYSLLVGMADDGSEDKTSKRKPNMVDSSFQNIFQQYMHGTGSLNADCGEKEIAYFGIIDVLQQYNTRKKLEHLLKSVRYEGDNISIVQPSYYAKRFVDFITSKFAPESEARGLIAERAAEERKEKRRSSKDKEKSKRLKLSVPQKEKESSKTPTTSDGEESSVEETRGKRSNTVY